MINKLIEIEQERLKKQGFDSLVSAESITITSALDVVYLGADIYFLTGIMPSDSEMIDSHAILSLYSPVNSVQLTQKNIALLGLSIYKRFQEFIIIKTMNDTSGFNNSLFVTPFRLDFVRVSPIKQA